MTITDETLSSINVPFGKLDIETKLALHRAFYEGKEIQFKNQFTNDEWISINNKNTQHIGETKTKYRLKSTPLTDIVVPWEAIDPQWKWAARDFDGRVYLFEDKPFMRDEFWDSLKKFVCVSNVLKNFAPGSKSWDKSLIERPSSEKRSSEKGYYYD